MSERVFTVDTLFAGKEAGVEATYRRLLDALSQIGPIREEPKKTSIHLCHRVSFAGVHPRQRVLYLTLRTATPLAGPRVVKTEQVSKNRFHNDIKLLSPSDVDAECIGWLTEAYALAR